MTSGVHEQNRVTGDLPLIARPDGSRSHIMPALVLSKDRSNRALLTALGSAVTLAVIFTIFDSNIEFAHIPTGAISVFAAFGGAWVRLPQALASVATDVTRAGKWPLVLSGTALLISSLTLYLTCLRAPRLRPMLGDLLLLHYTPDGHLQVAPELTIFNTGARPGAVVKVTGKISHVGGDTEALLHWISFQELTPGARPGERNLPYTTFAGHPQTLVIGRSEAASKRVAMICERQLRLLPGSYRLEIRMHTGAHGRGRVVMKRTLEISREEERWAYENRASETASTIQNLGLYYNPEKRCFSRLGAPPE